MGYQIKVFGYFVSIFDLFMYFFTFILVLCVLISNYNIFFVNVVAGLVLFYSVYLLFEYRTNIGLFLMMFFIAYMNYSIVISVYWFPEMRIPLFNQFRYENVYGIGMLCILFFELTLYYFSKKKYSKVREVNNFDGHLVNNYVAYICLAIYIIIFFTQFKFGQSGVRASNSALGEYRIIFEIVGFYSLNRNNKYFKSMWMTTIIITSILTLIGGNRADAINTLLAFIIFWYGKKLNARLVSVLLIPTLFLLIMVGYMRVDFSFTVDAVRSAFIQLTSKKLIYDGATFAFVPTLASIELSTFTSLIDKVLLLGKHIIYIVFGSSLGIPDLAVYSREFYVHYYGFVSPIYFYFWFGYISPFLFGFLMHIYIDAFQFVNKNDNRFLREYKLVISLFAVSTISRSYSYGPMILLRGAFVCSVVFFLMYIGKILTNNSFKNGEELEKKSDNNVY